MLTNQKKKKTQIYLAFKTKNCSSLWLVLLKISFASPQKNKYLQFSQTFL